MNTISPLELAAEPMTAALRPVAILEFLARSPQGVTLRELRDEVGLPRSSTWLLVRQLEEGGYISKKDANVFIAGPRLIRMGLSLYQTAGMGGDARILLQELSSRTGLDVYLAIRAGDSVVYADRVFGMRTVQVRRQLGEARPLHASAVGKLFLAYETDGLWERCIEGRELQRFSPETVTDHEELRRQIERIRLAGYVEINGEVLASIASVAMMVFNPDGSPWAAVVLSAHEADLAPQRDEAIAQLRITTAQIAQVRADLHLG